MRTLSIINLAVFATGLKRVDPIIPGCPCLQNNSCLPDSNCRIALARTKRESNIPLNHLDKRLLRDYGIGECSQCNGQSNVVPNPVEAPTETVYMYRQPIVQAVPQYVLEKPAAAPKPAIVIPKTVNVPVQYTAPRNTERIEYINPDYVFPITSQKPVEYVNVPSQVQNAVPRVVINQPVVKTISVPLKPTVCQRRKLRAAANQAAKTLEYEPCPQCLSCNQPNIEPDILTTQPNPVQPILIRRTTTTETEPAPVTLSNAPQRGE